MTIINYKRAAIAIVFLFVFAIAGLVVWNAAYSLAEITGLHYRVFDVIAVFLLWCGFVSTCIATDSIDKKKDESEVQEND